MLEEIKQLRTEGKTPNEIENLLLDGKLGKIWTSSIGRQYIESIQVSQLVVEIHESGYIDYVTAHPRELVVHHIDGNVSNNIYSNVQIMKWSDHASLHRTDPMFGEVEKVRREKQSESLLAHNADPMNAEDINARNEKISDWYKDPLNAEDIEIADKKRSKSMKVYYADPANAEAEEVKGKNHSKTARKNNGWITPESDPEFFENSFTAKNYAKASDIPLATAQYRLGSLIRSGEITCEKELIGGKWCNIYRSTSQ